MWDRIASDFVTVSGAVVPSYPPQVPCPLHPDSRPLRSLRVVATICHGSLVADGPGELATALPVGDHPVERVRGLNAVELRKVVLAE